MAPNGRLTLFERYDIFVCPISESMPECLALQQKYASLFHIKKCSTQYVAHFIWVTESLKIGEYVTICSTQYILPFFQQFRIFCPHDRRYQVTGLPFCPLNSTAGPLPGCHCSPAHLVASTNL